MGIDIRDGFQLECIGCGLCIDACNEVMAKVDRPLNLIAYDSERNQELRAAGQPERYRVVRPRTILYTAIIAAVALVMLGALALRSSTDVNVIPERNPLFVTMADGSIRNGYQIKILNKERADRTYTLALADPMPDAVFQHTERERPVHDSPPARTRSATHRVFLGLPRAALTEARRPSRSS